jgi:hypothetical protein
MRPWTLIFGRGEGRVFCGDFLYDLDLEITLGNQLPQPRAGHRR